MKKPTVFIVILNWNGWQDTLRCLESTRQLEYPHFRVVCVDNGSEDDSVSRLIEWGRNTESCKRHLDLLESAENLGFTGGCDLGIEHSLRQGADYVFLLNNDATVQPETLCRLVASTQEANAAIAGARIINEDGSVEFAGKRWPGNLIGRGNMPNEQRRSFWVSSYASGCAMLIRRDFLERRRGESGHMLDPLFFMYCEEVDLCRYGAARGYKCIVVRDAIVSHRQAASSGGRLNPRSYYYLTRNRIFLANRWLNPASRFLFHAYYLSSRVAIVFLRLIRRQRQAAWAILEGLVDGYRGVSGKWRRHNDRRPA